MANNIYRRQPVPHKLPTDYASIDNVKYFNINNISGLQVYDNPLVAAQNSTYNCKNVYRDELGNLTVRPAVHHMFQQTPAILGSTVVTWYKETKYGIAYINNFAGSSNPQSYDTFNLELHKGVDSRIWQKIIPHGSTVVIEETEDAVYVLLNVDKDSKQELEFWKFYEGETQIESEQVIGEIQLNNTLKPDLSLYNILNNKTYTEQVIIDSDDSKNKYDKLQSIIAKMTVPPMLIKKIIKYKYGAAIFYYENSELKILLVNTSGITTSINVGEYTPDTSSTASYCILDYPNAEYFDITFSHYKLVNSNNEKFISELTVSYSGVVKVVAETSVINKNISGKYFSDARPLYNGYYVGFAFGENTADSKAYSLTVHICKGSSIVRPIAFNDCYYSRTYAKNLYNVFALNGYIIFATIPVTFANNTGYAIDYNSYDYLTGYHNSGSLEGVAQLKFDPSKFECVSFDNCCIVQPFIWQSTTGGGTGPSQLLEPRIFAIVKTSVTNNIRFVDNWPSIGSSRYSISPLNFTTDSKHIYVFQKYLDFQSQVITFISDTGDMITKDIKKYYFENEYFTFVFDDWVFTSIDSNSVELYKRQVRGSNIPVDRPIDRIPVLSQFGEDIVTSFFLDGYYWFITEHHIFGTGAANGKLTIEFFDPMKYFAVTETLMAAVRVSDTSFWVFHNNGAYLIYKSTMSTENGTQYVWMCTNTAKSKGCDFKNAIVTLPVTSAVAVVTAEDICSVEMKENIQSDDRTLVPMTLSFRQMIRDLLETTESIKIATYHYLTIFFLNQVKKDLFTPAVVYDSTIDSWWYWEFPFVQVFNIYQTETNVKIYAEYGAGSNRALFKLSEDSFVHTVNAIDYTVYADKLPSLTRAPYVLSQINWEWESAILIFDTVDFRKQLLFTTFVFDDYNIPEDKYANHSSINFEYYFNIYSRKYANTSPQATSTTVYRVTNNACRTMVANFNYLQLILKNRKSTDDNEGYEAMNKPKICSISLKYRILRGAIT